ncbi:MAG: DUF1659 domain-containing protein [Acidaminococcaceae bacterium]|nr:DUF1659 domain-containing protein [Acidaminococcaceae bacterium]
MKVLSWRALLSTLRPGCGPCFPEGRWKDAEGNAISKSYIYNNVKPDAEPAKLLAVGTALGGLFDNEITGLTVVERANLANE